MTNASISEVRAAYYQRIRQMDLAPLWEVLGALVPPQPVSACAAAHWPYEALLPHLQEAGRLISAEEAERRVLVLENPSLAGQSRITRSLYAGMQLLLPGEVAHSHRHTATAIRLMVSGRGAFTSVDGERTPMSPGDFIITPSWTYHDHSNPGDEPVIWLDGLDVPIIQLLEAGFSDRWPDASQPIVRPDGDMLARYGSRLLPVDEALPNRNPVFCYPYARTRPALEQLAASQQLHPSHAVRQQFVNPLTGGAATRTMMACMQWLPRGFRGVASRSTDSTVYCAVEGQGESRVGDRTIAWRPHDVFVVPSWQPVRHETDTDSVLFSFSDRPVQQALGVWREELA